MMCLPFNYPKSRGLITGSASFNSVIELFVILAGVTEPSASLADVTDDVCSLAVETESSVIVPVVRILPIPAARMIVFTVGVKFIISVEPETE